MSDKMRINKYLSQAGVLSRRKADEAVAEGLITINGNIAQMGDMVGDGDVVMYNGVDVSIKSHKDVIVAYNKPLGLVCTSKEADKDSIFRKLDVEADGNLYYVGRLDKDSQGLLLLTNDGELANQIQKARNHHEKEYVVRVDKEIDEAFLKAMRSGVPILDRVTRPCKVYKKGPNTFSIILTEGINRQIRRMCEYLGYRVVYLKRIRVMNIKIGDLKPGEYRFLEPDEERKLRGMCR